MIEQMRRTPEYQEKNEREKLWEEKLKELESVKDATGKGMDKGIKESVAALNLLNIDTQQSCEGHEDHGAAAPWISIFPKEAYKYVPQIRKLSAEMQEIGDKNRETPEFKKVHDEFRRITRERDLLVEREYKKAVTALEEFYRERDVSFGRRLILGSDGRLLSQGGLFQQIEDPELRSQRLGEYQQEMQDFTEFLKKKFFE